METNGGGSTSRPAALKLLVAIEAVLALIGVASGFGMLSDPSGEGMGLPPDLLDGAPVADYTLVGLFFITFYGALPSAAAYGLWTGRSWRWTAPLEGRTGRHWSWTASVALGLTMLVWIGVEVAVLGVMTGVGGALQAAVTALGLVVLTLATRPSVKEHTRIGR